MKKLLKKVSMIICSMVITLGLVGANVSQADAATKYVKFKYTLDVSLKADATISNGNYKIYLKGKTGKAIPMGTAKKSGSTFKLKGSSTLSIPKGTTGYLQVIVEGTDLMGEKVSYDSGKNYLKVSSKGFLPKTIKVRGYGHAPTISK